MITGDYIYSPIDNRAKCPTGCPLCYLYASGELDCKDKPGGTILFHVDSLQDVGLSPSDPAVLSILSQEGNQ